MAGSGTYPLTCEQNELQRKFISLRGCANSATKTPFTYSDCDKYAYDTMFCGLIAYAVDRHTNSACQLRIL